MVLVIASIFFNLKADTKSFFQRGAPMFFAVLINGYYKRRVGKIERS